MEKSFECPNCGKFIPSSTVDGLCPECLLKGGLETGADLGEPTQTQDNINHPRFIAPSVSDLVNAFPQLEIIGLIGQGGMGAVYKAKQKKLDRVVALKILPPDIGSEQTFAERFSREAKALAKLNHPGIVTIHDFGLVTLPRNNSSAVQPSGQNMQQLDPVEKERPLFFFMMEYVDGVNLQQLLQGDRISSHEALSIVPQICDALQYAHDHGVVHRDIKPENILLDRRGAVKVADFGLAKMIAGVFSKDEANSPNSDGQANHVEDSQDLTESGKVMGTPKYMSPEQFESPSAVDHRTDIYALGVVFYQMLTGELPDRKFVVPSKKVRLDVRLDEIVLKALEKNPTKRYQEVSTFKTQLESVANADSLTKDNHSSKSKEPLPHALSNIPWQIWLVVCILGLRGMAALFTIPYQPDATVWLLVVVAFVTGLLLRSRLVYVLVLGISIIPGIFSSSIGPFGPNSFFGFLNGPVPQMTLQPSLQPMVILGNLLIFFLMLSQFRFYFFDRSQGSLSPQDRKILYRISAGISWLIALPAIGFGAFFIHELGHEHGGWNPAPAEAVFVPLTWVCALLLPCLGWFLWKQSLSPIDTNFESKDSRSNQGQREKYLKGDEVIAIVGVVLMLLLIASGDAIIMVIGAMVALIAGMFFMPRNKILLGALVVLVSCGLAACVGILISNWL